MRKSRCLGLLVGALLFSAPGDARRTSDHEAFFILGLRAMDQERWLDALTFFSYARDRETRPGGLVRPYGTWYAYYAPSYYQGLTLYRLGRFAEALDAWNDAEEKYYHLEFPRNRRLRNRRDRLIAELASPLDDAFERLGADLSRLEQDLSHLEQVDVLRTETTARPTRSSDSVLDADGNERVSPDDLRIRISNVRRDFEVASDQDTACRADCYASLQAQKKAIEAALREVQLGDAAYVATLETEKRRRDAVRDRYKAAIAALETAPEPCSDGGKIVSHLEQLLHAPDSPGLYPDERIDLRGKSAAIYLWGKLAEAHARCGEPTLAALYSELSKRHDPWSAGESSDKPPWEGRDTLGVLPELSDEVLPRWPSGSPAGPSDVERAAANYLLASALIDLRECRDTDEMFEALRKEHGSSEGGLADAKTVFSKRRGDRKALPNPTALIYRSLAVRRQLAQALGTDFQPYLSLAQAARNCQDRASTRFFLDWAERTGSPSVDARRPLETWLEESAEGSYLGGYALVVGVYDYEHMKDLPGVETDIHEIRNTLATQGYDVTLVENPTRDQLSKALDRFAKDHGGKKTHLFFYFAGHGTSWVLPKDRRGGNEVGGDCPCAGARGEVANVFLVPSDGKDPTRELDIRKVHREFDLYSMGQLFVDREPGDSFFGSIDAQHLTIVFDSCFAGSALDMIPDARTYVGAGDPTELASKRASFVVTAGGAGQTTPDRSVFRRLLQMFLQGVGEEDRSGKGVGPTLALGQELGALVTRLVPAFNGRSPALRWAPLFGEGPDLMGDVAFERTALFLDESARWALETEIRMWRAAWGTSVALPYQHYVRLYPEGRFEALARCRLASMASLPPPTHCAHFQ